MGIGNKISNMAEELTGKIKSMAGEATDDEQLEAEGEATSNRPARRSRTSFRTKPTQNRPAGWTHPQPPGRAPSSTPPEVRRCCRPQGTLLSRPGCHGGVVTAGRVESAPARGCRPTEPGLALERRDVETFLTLSAGLITTALLS